IFSLITVGLIIILNTSLLLPAPLGKLLSPQHGIWQNAEPVDEDYTANLSFPQLTGKVNVYLDERLVPHIFAEQENDAYFVQGYLHAKFRLWQMELQTLAAAGRASEKFGDMALDHDREFRRLGMVFAAENSLKEVEKDAVIKAECDAYTAGVNAYIESLTESQLPIEYKLIGYLPEKWSNFKTALFSKYMAYDLAAHENDFEMTSAKSFFSKEDFEKLYPETPDSADPVIPKGTVYSKPKVVLQIPASADSLYFTTTAPVHVNVQKPDKDNGSNNWAISGKNTKSGYPILANDLHLGLNLPSLWYEIQISTPDFNVNGVSFPGTPGVIVGFNDSCAFGFTNAGRDVRDYYEIKFKDDSRKEYWFNNGWTKTDFRYEKIKIKGKPDYIDTVAYTLLGPVMFDKSYTGNKTPGDKNYAVRWKAHDPSNELKLFNMLNHAKTYADYSAAVVNLHTPGQNCVFASKSGDIAIRTQGEFPAKWKGQGDFIMPGTDSSYMWQAMIPMDETPFQYNPERNFVSSSNQLPADSGYPYYLGSGYTPYRGIIVNRRLNAMNNISVDDIKNLQTDNYNVFGEMASPVFIKNMKENELNADEKKYFDILRTWDFRNDVNSKGATIFYLTWEHFEDTVWNDEFAKAPKTIKRPFESTLLEAILKDSAYKFLDDINTSQLETLPDNVTSAFKKAVVDLKEAESKGRLEWAKYKDTKVQHLTKLEAFSRLHLPIGGGTHCINAAKSNHGPSWRMIVSLTPQAEAYGVYPGGQSGNPGSRYYDNFIDTWVAGKYYTLWVMKQGEENDKRIKWKMSFSKN
ncbi:MAG TPA: penicillin acylase family protein, partial [Chitinophagaceae bacterium]|nr:penicillin acylase family protein [Chitinophagaceae bacterium]